MSLSLSCFYKLCALKGFLTDAEVKLGGYHFVSVWKIVGELFLFQPLINIRDLEGLHCCPFNDKFYNGYLCVSGCNIHKQICNASTKWQPEKLSKRGSTKNCSSSNGRLRLTPNASQSPWTTTVSSL